jgi:S-methylmethionine-dependent homocysteine/selenocysteine methylase
MATYRNVLPQMSGERLLSDSGIETDLIFHHGYDLPLFASFPLVDDPRGTDALHDYYWEHAMVAKDAHVGFVLESPTWRASLGWASQLGYNEASLDRVNRRAISMMAELRDELGELEGPVVISGAVGPRDDAYRPEERMSPEEAQRYHMAQIRTLSTTEADLITAFTITYSAEAVGISRAAAACEMPVAISFTLETDGRLPDGTTLAQAINAVDQATEHTPIYFGINCAHPTHFSSTLDPGEAWTERVGIIRANASRMSHAELDDSEVLDDGDPDEFAHDYALILERFPRITVLGGCCGTDVRHIRAVAHACL